MNLYKVNLTDNNRLTVFYDRNIKLWTITEYYRDEHTQMRWKEAPAQYCQNKAQVLDEFPFFENII